MNQKNRKPKRAKLPTTPPAIPPIAPGVNPLCVGGGVVEIDTTDDVPVAVLVDVVLGSEKTV